jgi:hypothetical protein
MSGRRWGIGVALFAVALLLSVGVPHGHLQTEPSKDDCVLCHVHNAPVVESRQTESIPDFISSAHEDEILDGEERDAALGRHPSRAPPA